MNMDLLEYKKILDISPISVIFAVSLTLLGILYLKLHSGPPGPWGLPFFGLWPFLRDKTIHRYLQKHMKKYGDVYSFNYAGKLYIHLGTIKAYKEAVVMKSDCFANRFSGFCFLNKLYAKGMLIENGDRWRVLRKFFINAFREHGVTSMKDYMSGPILDSVNSVVDDLRAKNGKPVDIVSILTARSSEILRRVMFNDDEISVEELKEIIKEYEKIAPAFGSTSSMLNGEFVRYFIFPFIKAFKTALESHNVIAPILKKIIARHEASFDKYNIRDIIDSYIQERNERKAKGDPTAEYFTENALVSSLIQFVGDGITAIAIFIAFFINSLLEYPEEQEKIHKELEEVVGSDRQPTLQDKTKLSYLNAFIQEVQRKMDFINMFIDVECTKETTLNGHNIPKGALLLVNVFACHRDPSIFDEPDEFRPSRYIVEPGQQKPEAPIVFGMGKRGCIGESFAMMQVFLFLTAVIKNFRLTRLEGTTKKLIPDLIMEICAHPRK